MAKKSLIRVAVFVVIIAAIFLLVTNGTPIDGTEYQEARSNMPKIMLHLTRYSHKELLLLVFLQYIMIEP